jgi:hypothetical protein
MANPLISDKMWELIESMALSRPLWTIGGRPPVPERDSLTTFVSCSGIRFPWEVWPQEMGCGVTCRRSLRY